ncbi:MAG: DUF1273 family protein [Clostridia bacterium]|nr:DUF1273 family protein [Clostridia bacterium]
MRRIGKNEYDCERQLGVCFTGHRPDKLPWGRDEDDERCAALKKRIENEIKKAYSQGARYFLSGMADGVDTYAAEAVLKLSILHPGMKLIAVFPYGEGDSPRKKRIARRAYRVVSLHDEYTRTCFFERNLFLVKNSARVIACFGGDTASGTASTLKMARQEGIDIVILNIDD